MKNAEAIHLNNRAVDLLRSGNVVQAFDALSRASHIIASAGADHAHVDTDNSTYRFTWVDCRAAIVASVDSTQQKQQKQQIQTQSQQQSQQQQQRQSIGAPSQAQTPRAGRDGGKGGHAMASGGSLASAATSATSATGNAAAAAAAPCRTKRPARVLLNNGRVPFLFLRALRVTTAPGVDLDRLCPCGYAWVVWYNLAICCSVLGMSLGERGLALLQTGFDLYARVQCRVDNEPPSKQWNILQMAVLNNQACIYSEYHMGDAVAESLRRLQDALGQSPCVQGQDRDAFLLSVQILGACRRLAVAA